MCIKHAPETIADLRKLADEIEKRFSLNPTDEETFDKSTTETLQSNSDFSILLTEVVNSLLGIVLLKEELVNKDGTRPDLKGITIPRVLDADYDAIVHSVYNIAGE